MAPLVGCIDGKLLFRVQVLDPDWRDFLTHGPPTATTWIYIDKYWYKEGLVHTIETTDPERFGHERERL